MAASRAAAEACSGQAGQVHGTPELVTLHLWGVRRRHLPWALSRMALHRGSLRAAPGLRFARLLGTGHGESFTPADADPGHWALLSSWETPAHAATFERSAMMTAWNDHSHERWRLGLRPLTSHGLWSGQQPFGPSRAADARSQAAGGPCAVLTRARLHSAKAATFWRSIPPVARALHTADGLRFARGIGEAPIGLQATFSVWDDEQAAADFAYRSPEHRLAIERTAQTGWYAEQLFARFAVVEASGIVNGRDPLLIEGAP